MFALAGWTAWSYLSGSVESVTGSILVNGSLVTKVYFPRLVAPLAAVLPGLIDLVIALAALAVLMAAMGVVPPAVVVLLPGCVVLLAVVALSIGLWLATLNVLYRDVGHAVGFALQLWFFATPVAYPASLVHGPARLAYALNPAAGAIEAFRAVLVGGPLRADELVVSLITTGLLLVGGRVYVAFGSTGPEAVDYHGWVFGFDATTLAPASEFCAAAKPGPPDGS